MSRRPELTPLNPNRPGNSSSRGLWARLVDAIRSNKITEQEARSIQEHVGKSRYSETDESAGEMNRAIDGAIVTGFLKNLAEGELGNQEERSEYYSEKDGGEPTRVWDHEPDAPPSRGGWSNDGWGIEDDY
jgi:hypothetical protein